MNKSPLNTDSIHMQRCGVLAGCLCTLAFMALSAGAAAQPAQRPLLVLPKGAKPNLVLTLDNSGSMAFPFAEDYVIASDDTRGGYWMAQRSSEVNPLYYNPRVTYKPRVNASGESIQPNDGLLFLSNQASANFEYSGFSRLASDPLYPSMIAGRSDRLPFFLEQRPAGSNFEYFARQEHPVSGIQFWARVPVHVSYRDKNSLDATTPAFSYALCSKVTLNPLVIPAQTFDPATGGQHCDVGTIVDVRPNSATPIALPDDHQRTDCGPKTCSSIQEIDNILNWYRYYSYRMLAVTTAIGHTLADSRLNNRLRIGYQQINDTFLALPRQMGVDVSSPSILRGVRSWEIGSADNKQLYDWLYSTQPRSATPLHNTLDKVANYLRVPAEALENPWAQNPRKRESAANPEMNCRRSYHMLLSDGAWNANTTTAPAANHDNTAGPAHSTPVAADGKTRSLAYSPTGPESDRKLYTPYPSAAIGMLSDLAARYYWHEDLRSSLDNEVPTRFGQPTFWQNMTTYTVGYMIRPSGMEPGATGGLTFDQIAKYRKEHVAKGYADATKPSWPLSFAKKSDRIDDFVQAGYAGGGRSFSVRSSEDIVQVFNTVLADILTASGNDAGIDQGELNPQSNTQLGRVKYGVDFDTVDNSGEVYAKLLDANGVPRMLNKDANEQTLNPASEYWWRASTRMPQYQNRQVFSIRSNNIGFELKGDFSKLPEETRNRLKTGEDAYRIPDDSRFVDYLRGNDAVLDTAGVPFRARKSLIGASVNAPPLILGDLDNIGYDLSGNVSGKTSYADFRARIKTTPASVFVASNAGVVHALAAATGNELAAFMPLRSMSGLLKQANDESPFEYLLDGAMTDHDVFDGKDWHQLAVGTGGRGEKLIYGLRSPFNADGKRVPGVSDFLWETGPDKLDDAHVTTGYMSNPVRGGQTDAGHWVVVVNNGHYNGRTDGTSAGLVVLNALTGAKIRSIPLPADYSAGRGLGGVTVVRDSGKRIVAAYAGDANGQLWRFNLRGPSDTWSVAYGKPLFTTPDRRPIYAAPAWQAHPKGGFIVVIGTGIMLDEADVADTKKRESLYGIWDPTSRAGVEAPTFETVSDSELLEQQQLEVVSEVNSLRYFKNSTNKIDWKVHRGWKRQLGEVYPGERSLDQIRNIGSSVVINTTILAQPAADGPESCTTAQLPPNNIIVLNALDGVGKPAFDINGDGKLDEVSSVFVARGGFLRNIGVATLKDRESMTHTQKVNESVRTNLGESDPEQTACRSARVALIGTGSESLKVGVDCASQRAWSRQQYQLTELPK